MYVVTIGERKDSIRWLSGLFVDVGTLESRQGEQREGKKVGPLLSHRSEGWHSLNFAMG